LLWKAGLQSSGESLWEKLGGTGKRGAKGGLARCPRGIKKKSHAFPYGNAESLFQDKEQSAQLSEKKKSILYRESGFAPQRWKTVRKTSERRGDFREAKPFFQKQARFQTEHSYYMEKRGSNRGFRGGGQDGTAAAHPGGRFNDYIREMQRRLFLFIGRRREGRRRTSGPAGNGRPVIP
jgi:hypothetical protein